MIRVFLLIAHDELRHSTREFLEEHGAGKIAVIGAGALLQAHERQIAQQQPDVLLLMTSIDILADLRALPRLRALAPHCSIIVAGNDSMDALGDLLAHVVAHADSYIDSGSLATRLIPAILQAAQHHPAPMHTGESI